MPYNLVDEISFPIFQSKHFSFQNVNEVSFLGEISPDKMSGDDSASRRIVHKLRSDVKVNIASKPK